MKRVLVVLSLFLFIIQLGFCENLQSVISQYHPDMSKGLIFVSKIDMTLTLADNQGNIIKVYPMACGKNIGPKRVKGDNKTPEGVFSLEGIQDASKWGHDFNDGKGYIRDAYGPWFLRLKTGFIGIGIHGTHDPNSIGTRASEGCIRLNNRDIADLHDRVKLGMTVIIGHEPSGSDLTQTTAWSLIEPDSILQYIRPSWNWPPLEEEAIKVKNPTKKQQ